MTAGRKPTTNKVKVIRGTNQPCRMKNELEPDPITEIESITDPKKLKILKTRRSKRIFKEKANQLLNLKVLTELDFEQLAIYSNSLDMVFKCIEELKKGHFLEIHDENGVLLRYVENPYLKLYKDMINIVNKMAGDFGFTPISRTKFNIEDDKPKDELSKYM